jgi:hypothetical protein
MTVSTIGLPRSKESLVHLQLSAQPFLPADSLVDGGEGKLNRFYRSGRDVNKCLRLQAQGAGLWADL